MQYWIRQICSIREKLLLIFNSGFQISGVETNSPDLVDQIDCAPLPKINADDPDYGAETSNIPMVVWKNSKHPEICKAFMKNYMKKIHI